MLTDVKARKLKPGEKSLLVGGVTGLYLQAGLHTGAGKFIFRFVSPVSGKRRDMGLGTYPTIGLAEARQKALKARDLIANQIDPIEKAQRRSLRQKA